MYTIHDFSYQICLETDFWRRIFPTYCDVLLCGLGRDRYGMTVAALGLIGVSEDETVNLFRSLAGVLFLGQVCLSLSI